MTSKEIDDMFFRKYGYKGITDEEKEALRKTFNYAGFVAYTRQQEFANIFLNTINKQFKQIAKALTK